MRVLHLVVLCGMLGAACEQPKASVSEVDATRLADFVQTVVGISDEDYVALTTRPESDGHTRQERLARALFAHRLKNRSVPASVDLDRLTNEELRKLRQSVGSWKSHLERGAHTPESIRADARARLHLKVLANQAAEKEIEDKDVRDEYAKVRARYSSPEERIAASQILIEQGRGEQEAQALAAKKRAEKLRKDIENNPEKFAELASASGTLNAPRGKLGVFALSTRPYQFPLEFFGKPEGWVSGVIAGKSGYRIFRVDRRFAPGDLPYDQMAERLRRRVIARAADRHTTRLTNEIWKEVLEDLQKEDLRKRTDGKELIEYVQSRITQ